MINSKSKKPIGKLIPSTQCVCCGNGLRGKERMCGTCRAPRELTVTVVKRGKPARFVPVLGASGAGKTVYLGLLLDMLSKGTGTITGLATNTYSVAMQTQTVAALEARRFPAKTPCEPEGWQWVHCEVSRPTRRRQYLDIVTPDFAGEAIAMEIEQPGMYPVIRAVVRKSLGLLFLCDSLKMRDSSSSEDLFNLKIASYIYDLHNDEKTTRGKRKLQQPIAFVFTKCDWCPEALEDPAKFAASNMPRFFQFCQQSFARCQYFGVSVVGSSGHAANSLGRRAWIPFHVEPRGITTPLEWIMKNS